MTIVIRNQKQLEEAKEELADLKKAKKKILEAQSYAVDSSQITRANLQQVSKEISEYSMAIDAYEQRGSSKRRSARIIPMD